MVGQRILVAALLLILSCAFLLAAIPTAMANTNYPNASPGQIGGEEMRLPANTVFDVNLTGDGGNHFNVYIVTMDDYNRSVQNESFGYFQEFSRLNVTSTDVHGSLPAGDYYVLVQAVDQGGIFMTDVTVTPSPAGTIPWDTLAIVAVTAIISITGTFLVMRMRSHPK